MCFSTPTAGRLIRDSAGVTQPDSFTPAQSHEFLKHRRVRAAAALHAFATRRARKQFAAIDRASAAATAKLCDGSIAVVGLSVTDRGGKQSTHWQRDAIADRTITSLNAHAGEIDFIEAHQGTKFF